MKGSGLLSLNLLKTIYYVGTLNKNVSTKLAFPFFFTLKDNVLFNATNVECEEPLLPTVVIRV